MFTLREWMEAGLLGLPFVLQLYIFSRLLLECAPHKYRWRVASEDRGVYSTAWHRALQWRGCDPEWQRRQHQNSYFPFQTSPSSRGKISPWGILSDEALPCGRPHHTRKRPLHFFSGRWHSAEYRLLPLPRSQWRRYTICHWVPHGPDR